MKECVVVLFSWTRTDFLCFAGVWEVHWTCVPRSKLEMTDSVVCGVGSSGSDYAGGGSGPDLQGESIQLASAEERSCWQAGNRVSLTGTAWRRDSSDGCWRVSNTSSWSEGSNNLTKIPLHKHSDLLQLPRPAADFPEGWVLTEYVLNENDCTRRFYRYETVTRELFSSVYHQNWKPRRIVSMFSKTR